MTTKDTALDRPGLHGVALHAVRVLWVILVLLILGLFVASIIHRLVELVDMHHPERLALMAIGIPVELYAVYFIILDAGMLMFFTITAAAIFWRRSHDWMAVLVSVALLTFATVVMPSLDTLRDNHQFLGPVVIALRGMGVGTALMVFYLFPTGKFVPAWTRYLAAGWGAYLLFWLVSLAQHNPMEMGALPGYVRPLAYLLRADPKLLFEQLRYFGLLMILAAWFGTGVWAQIHRYKCVSSPGQRHQTKWIVLSLIIAFVGYLAYNLSMTVIPALREPGLYNILFKLIGRPVFILALIMVPIFIGISISLYRLWDIDFLINRTMVYGTLTTLMGVLYVGVILLIPRLYEIVVPEGGQEPPLVIAATTLALAALFRPLKDRLQSVIDRMFYREKVDFRQAFTDFSRQVRTIIDKEALLHMLVDRTTELLHIEHGAVYLCQPDGRLQFAHSCRLPQSRDEPLQLDAFQLNQLQAGNPISRPRDLMYTLLVPLTSPRVAQVAEAGKESGRTLPTLQGVLALGPRRSGLGYFREDQTLLMGLADQAGTSLYVAQLIEEQQVEARRREEVEDRLAEYRASPAGQAEALAQKLVVQPAGVLLELHDLAQKAGQDPLSASLLTNLPNALSNLNARPLAGLAEAFNYFVTSQYSPELVSLGLRTLITQLVQPEAEAWEHAKTALPVYQGCQLALEANSILQIIQSQGGEERVVPAISDAPFPAFLLDVDRALKELNTVAEALRAYERVDTAQDKLAYLASAVDRLRHVDRLVRADLGSADRAMVQRIAQDWLAIITGAMGDLQARARIVCHLITRHTWQDQVVALALNVRNEGRGSAMNVRVTLAADQDYTVVDQAPAIARIGPNEEVQVQLRVRPRLEKGIDYLRARFVVLYTDPRGADQVENFADVVQLLTTEGQFQFVPNPYVVGTPLPGGSSLFFGREDVFAFVQENLNAMHRNNLVLIGQRRTGKTSLLKQLPVRLSDEVLPVYLDGQALGLDPGMRNFFLTLATEVAFALEDRGFEIAPPESGDFEDGPAGSFENKFLVRVRQAIGQRHLLLMLDEFEELEAAVRRGDLEASIFGFLRHLIQHSENLSVIFCGTHRLEELASDYWNVLFNISLYKHIAFLEKAEAMRLIQDPVAPYGMRYDDLALDKMWRVTAGHPYFMQLLCHSLVNLHNKTQRSYITVADVNTALDEILASGEAHFVYLWTESTPTERLALTTLSRLIPLTGRATPVQVADYLEERGVTLERQGISDALHHLALRDVLSVGQGGEPALGEEYQWKLGLLSLWVEKYKSLSRILDEMK
jgi:hypothetical protein